MKLIDLFESFTYKGNLTWNGDIGYFDIGGFFYDVRVRMANPSELATLGPFVKNHTTLKVGNIDFAELDPETGKRTQTLTGNAGKYAMRVFSVVAQAAVEQQQKYQYDMLLVIAKDDDPAELIRRADTYDSLCYVIARRIGWYNTELIRSANTGAINAVYNTNLRSAILDIRKYLHDYYNVPLPEEKPV
jgi:hypothetical protein